MEFHYFDFEGGRGPVCRIPLYHSGLDWKDVRVKGADFGAAKARGEYPTGLPILKLASGRVITQSAAIARFAAKHGDTGLYPTDPEAALIVDELMDVAADALTKTPTDKDEEKKKVAREEYAAGRLKAYMNIFNDSIAANGGPYVSGKTLTIADLAVDGVVSMITSGNFDYVDKSYADEWPALVAACALIKDSELFKSYAASRV
mmetsp:Transcript_65514/g.207109  ORF Transcript_65514/g.207109 Transcript_65514/m.207109 type:complete len:204 (+) Transcript_65514:215-826(+)